MPQERFASEYTMPEEIANSITHGIGLLLAVAGLVWLVLVASDRGDVWHLVGVTVFAASLIVLYGASTLYHSIPHAGAKHFLRVLDHSAIFLLIAGTYTPFTLVTLRGAWGWSLFGVIWGLALLGLALELTSLRRYRKVLISLYIFMGWVVLVAIKPLVDAIDPTGLQLLVLGGIAYTGGVAFYAWERLPYNHAIWHLFVLAGSTFHFFAILLFVLPPELSA